MLGWTLNLGMAGGTGPVVYATSYWIDWESKGFWPIQLGDPDFEPGAILEYDPQGDEESSEVILGGKDGYTRHLTQRQFSDDDEPFTSRVLAGPFKVGRNQLQEGIIQQIDGVITRQSGDMDWRLFVGRTAEEVMGPRRQSNIHGTFLVAGLNYTIRPRSRGSAAAIEVSNAEADDAWSFEEFVISTAEGGRRRATTR